MYCITETHVENFDWEHPTIKPVNNKLPFDWFCQRKHR